MNDPLDDSMERLADPAMLRPPRRASADAGQRDPSSHSGNSAFELADTDPELRPVDEYGLLVDPAAPAPRAKPVDGEYL